MEESQFFLLIAVLGGGFGFVSIILVGIYVTLHLIKQAINQTKKD